MPIFRFVYSNGIEIHVVEPHIYQTNADGGLELEPNSAPMCVVMHWPKDHVQQWVRLDKGKANGKMFTDFSGNTYPFDPSQHVLDVAYILEPSGPERHGFPAHPSRIFIPSGLKANAITYLCTSSAGYKGAPIDVVW